MHHHRLLTLFILFLFAALSITMSGCGKKEETGGTTETTDTTAAVTETPATETVPSAETEEGTPSEPTSSGHKIEVPHEKGAGSPEMVAEQKKALMEKREEPKAEESSETFQLKGQKSKKGGGGK